MNEQGMDTGGVDSAPAEQQSLPTSGNTQQRGPARLYGDGAPEGGEETTQEKPWWEGKNFDEAPPFRELKSKFDSTLSRQQQAYQAAQQQAQQAQYRMTQLERAIEEQQLAGKDDYEKLSHYYSKEKQRADALSQQLQAVQAEIGRQQYVSAIMNEFGVDLSNKQFTTPDEAMIIVARMQREKAAEFERKVQTLEKKAGAIEAADREKPDLGGGAPAKGSHALQRQWDEAMLNSQGAEADRVARQAIREGVQLNRNQWLTQRKKA